MSSNDHTAADDAENSIYQTKLAVHERDRYACTACGSTFDDPEQLDLDHIVPRGSGGSNRISNLHSLCRPCHRAKHEEDVIAPTIRFMSTGDMGEVEFAWFKHFVKEQIPALTRVVVEPEADTLFNLKNDDAWHIPIGDIRRIDQHLSNMDSQYPSLRAHKFM